MNADVVAQRPLKDAPLWVHLLAWGSFGVVTLATIALYYTYRDTDVWGQWLGSDGAQRWPKGIETHFNERIQVASIFRTPANTFSNLSYVFVGLYVLAYALWDFRRPVGPNAPYALRKPPLMVYFGIMCIGLGFGSAYMHAVLTNNSGWWDILFMFGSLVGIVALHWARWIPEVPLGAFRLPTWPLFIAIAAPFTYALAEVHGRFSDIQIMSALIGTIMSSFLLDFKLRRTIIQHRWWIFAVLSFAVAFGIWLLTNANRFTPPDPSGTALPVAPSASWPSSTAPKCREPKRLRLPLPKPPSKHPPAKPAIQTARRDVWNGPHRKTDRSDPSDQTDQTD